MGNEIIKYDPELNTIPLRKFTPVEMNLFFSIISCAIRVKARSMALPSMTTVFSNSLAIINHILK